MIATIFKLAAVASMGLGALGAVLPKGSGPTKPGEITVQDCYPNNWGGACYDGYCWATCDNKGNWAWLVNSDTKAWAGCSSSQQCRDGLSSGAMSRWECGGCA